MKGSYIVCITFSVFLGCAEQKQGIKNVADYKAEANAAVVAYDTGKTMEYIGDDGVVFVDVREGDEIARDGKIQGAVHVPRGFLEFYIDPASSMHLDIFSSGKKIIFYCETGGRSLLAAKLAVDMGVSDAVLLDGGFKAWVAAGGVIEGPSTD